MNTILLGFKTQLKINDKQRTMLLQHCGVTRHAWNWGLALTLSILEHNKHNSADKIKFPTAIDIHKWLVALVKPENPWYYTVSKCAPQYSLKALINAWDRCFKKKGGRPKFKKKGRHNSFTLDGSIKVEHYRIKVPVIGWLKTYERLPTGQKVKSVTINQHAGKWYISWKLETEITSPTKVHDVIGVDLGIKNLATLSTGKIIQGAKSYSKYEHKLKKLQWLNRHKVLGSNNWKKAQFKIARLHQYIGNIRKDTLHKLTTYLTKNHSKIVIEDLNVSGMLSNHKLAKAIQDMGFYEFRRQLEYKCTLYNSELIIVDRWYPSSKVCSSCGNKKEHLELSERIYTCECCGLSIDRDLNAALNLAVMAERPSVSACGVGYADIPTEKQEITLILRK